MCEKVNEKEKANVMISRTYKWSIDNFAKECLKHEPMVSSKFEYKLFEDYDDEERCASQWILKLYPDGFDDESKGYVCIEITLDDDEYDFDIQADFKLSILQANNEETNSHYATLHFDLEDAVPIRRLFRNFIKLDCILKTSSGLLSNDKLILLFSIGIQIGQNLITMGEPTYRSRLQLSDDLECFYNSKKFNDITFIVNGKEFQANKSILAARSPIFFSMFSLDMKEKNENSVKIDDIDPKVFKEMLKFIYTGKLQKHQFIEELLVVADKYAIKGLKEVCEKSLSNDIRIKNAMEIFQLADLHNAFDLKQQALQFIVDLAQYIIDTDGFKNIEPSQVHLIKELFCALANKYRYNDDETTQDPNKSPDAQPESEN